MWIWLIRYENSIVLLYILYITLLILFFLFVLDQNGQTPLFWASYNGHDKVVELLITLGKANVDWANKV